MAGFGEMFSNLFGGGGGGDGGAGQMQAYLDWQRQQQDKLDLSEKEADELAKTMISYRVGVLADRTGTAGTVNVGDAVQNTDARLAKRMEMLAADDPTRIAYDKSVSEEKSARETARMQMTGEEFEFRKMLKGEAGAGDSVAADVPGDDAQPGTLENVSAGELELRRLEGLAKLRGGRYANREDLKNAIAAAKRAIEEEKKRAIEEEKKRAIEEEKNKKKKKQRGDSGTPSNVNINPGGGSNR